MINSPECGSCQFAAQCADGYVSGTDEAGRGALAGPVVAASVILPCDTYIEGLRDSKKLSPKKRERLYDEIVRLSVCTGIGIITNDIIDSVNILNATHIAMRNSIAELRDTPTLCLIDGNSMKELPLPHKCVVGGDNLHTCIMAASVIAKVTRDNIMRELDAKYPQYGFAAHKGYGTAHHYQMIKQHGVSDIHRKSFRLG